MPSIRPAHFIPPLLALLSILAEPLAARAFAPGLLAALRGLPALLFLLFAWLAFRLNAVTVLLTSLVFLPAWLVLDRAGPGLPFLACLFSLSVPAGLLLLWGIGERRLLGPWSAARLAALVLPLALLLLRRAAPVALRELFNLRLLPSLPGWYLPDASAALAAALALLLALRSRDGEGPFRYALPWTAFPLLNALNAAFPRPAPSFRQGLSVGMAFIFLILLYGLYRLYWQRVYLDELTGIPNRRAFNERLRGLGARYALAMVDIDHFKGFNDTHGHAEGDNVLRWVALHLARRGGRPGLPLRRRGVRPGVRGGPRQGGGGGPGAAAEGPGGDGVPPAGPRPAEAGRLAAARARAARGAAGGERRKRVALTVSIGWAEAQRGDRRPEEVLRRADAALYQAKKEGRNRVVAALPGAPVSGPGPTGTG